MTGQDPYRDDPYGEYRDGPEDEARPGPRHATRPARPAWDAMTYGRPDDMRVPPRSAPPPPEPEPPLARPYESSSYGSSYGSGYPTTSYPPASYPPTSYPPASDDYPGAAEAYAGPGSHRSPRTESFAPQDYTSFEAAPTPPPPPLAGGSEPVYVAAGLYLDEPAANGHGNGWAGDATGPVGAYPGGAPEPQRARRTLPAFGARVAVGLGLGAVILTSLLLWRPAFLGVIAVAVGIAIWELVRAVRGTGVNPPLVPLAVGGVLMIGLAWWGGTDALTFGLAVTVLAAMAWRFAYGVAGYARDVLVATLIAVYVPFLAGFAAMLTSPQDGHRRMLATLIAVVLSDTGGYLVGAKLGRHAMAPSVSPKKSWEGLAGSLLAAALGSAVVVALMFHVAPWWGLLFGLGIAAASVIGDLGESMLKRDLGVKDMSGLLPGHGGIMDRLDSVLLAAPAGFLMLSAIAPVAG